MKFLSATCALLSIMGASAAPAVRTVETGGVRFVKTGPGVKPTATVLPSFQPRSTESLQKASSEDVASGSKLFLRTFDKNKEFVWSNFDVVDPATGALTNVVEEAFFFEVAMTIDGIGGFDYSSGSFLYATDVVFGKCTEIDIPVSSAFVGSAAKHTSPGPQYQLLLNSVETITTAGTGGGVFITGSSKGEFAVRKLVANGKDTAQTVYLLPNGIKPGLPAYESVDDALYLIGNVRGTNTTDLTILSPMSSTSPKAKSSSVDCSKVGAPGFPLYVHATGADHVVAVMEEASVHGTELFVVEIDLKARSCAVVHKFKTSGIVISTAYDPASHSLYLAEALTTGMSLWTIDVATKKASSVPLMVTPIDMAIGN
jgi:hypothetical protein